MPTLIVDDVPVDVYDRLQRRATARQRSVRDEAVALLVQILHQEETASFARLPELIATEEVAAPCDLPRTGPAVQVPYTLGRPRRPDPLSDPRGEP